MSAPAQAAYAPPESHHAHIAAEFEAASRDSKSARRTQIVMERMSKHPPTDFGGKIDWERELMAFAPLDYPEYYRQPFHSVPGGWLSKAAAVANRLAMDCIYVDAHPQSCAGLREELAEWVPAEARFVVDLGAGDGDGPAAVARARPKCRVVGVEASPFMIIAGRRQNRDVPNLEWRHALAEATGLPDACADAVTITLVLHECSDAGKRDIVAEALRLLKPGGTLVLADTPQDDLGTFRGFYEPHKEAWERFKVQAFLEELGFVEISKEFILGGTTKGSAAEHLASDSDHTSNRLFVHTAVKAPIAAPSRL